MKALVIGCGSIGQRHAVNAARHATVAVHDLDPARAQTAATAAGAQAFGDLAVALAWQPDVAIVATPHRHHLSAATAAIRAGAHVLIEKPLADTTAGVDAFLAEAAQRKRRAWVVCNMRFHPGVAALRRHLPRIGRVLYARAHYGNYLPSMRPGRDYRELYAARRVDGGGVILDAIHELDYLTWLLGDIEAVQCAAARLSALDIDVEDYATLALTHAGGARSTVTLDYLRQRKSRGCELIGEQGTLTWWSDGKAPERCRVALATAGAADVDVLEDLPDVDAQAPYAALVAALFAELARPGTTDLLDAATAARELAVALTARDAAPPQTGPARR